MGRQVPPGSQSALRAANARRVTRALADSGGLSQAELARRTGLSPASVTNIVRDLQATGRIEVTEAVLAGRKSNLVRLSRRLGAVVGVDVGRSHIRVAVADLGRDILAEHLRELPDEPDATTGLALAARDVAEALKAAGVERGDVIGVGVGVPGPLQQATGRIGAGALLPRWIGLDLREGFARALELPVVVENDANLGALGEYGWGPQPAGRTLVYIKITTGIGSGLLLDGALFRGAAGTAGEIGHTTVDEAGPLCRCGNRGCLETFASIPAILTLLAPNLGPDLHIEDVLAAAAGGDVACRRVVADTGRYLGIAVANLCNTLNPDRVVLGGTMAAAGDLLAEPVREEVRRRSIPAAVEAVRVDCSTLGNRSEVFGALSLAIGQFA